MCGIVGEFVFQSHLFDHNSTTIKHLSNLMVRRGPDDEGFWTDGICCNFGFRRLSILDLSPNGHQPMLTPNERFALVYNGELYNYQTIRNRLVQRGVRFRSTGDSEVILYALVEWGPSILNDFNGMFALAFYDRVDQKLLLARDHAGIKPLYYMATEQGVVFGSQYNQLLTHPLSQKLSVRPECQALYLQLGYLPAPYALLENTHMVSPGTWIEFNREGQREGRFFSFPCYQAPDLHGEEAFEAVNATITEAVRRQMMSDVPLGAFLSGGIDSPLVTAKMVDASNKRVKAFTISNSFDALDETEDAKAYAQELGVEHIWEDITPQKILVLLEQVTSACGEPLADYSIFPTLLVSQLARRHVTVVLSGDGGDELFWGYVTRFGKILCNAEAFAQPHWLRLARWGFQKAIDGGTAATHNLRWKTIGQRYQASHSTLPLSRYRKIFPDLPDLPVDFSLFDYAGHDIGETAQWLRWNEMTGHLTRILLKVDRASMYHSLEARVPLLDKEVVQVAARVDWASCLDLRTSTGKLPLRQALEQHVKYQTHVKRGFYIPFGEWLRDDLKALFEEKVIQRNYLLGLPINHLALQNLFDQHCANRGNYIVSLWTLLSLALWEDSHYIQRGALCASL
ncbi:MAG: asparagine synthase (glutamine-hydrolyzing) [Chloroflexi bacterium]|nr:asparagine synthase (glutamine-hydrolyzing) [Chloroflexota bacterium]